MRLTEALKTAGRLLVLDEKSVAITRWKLRRGDSTLRVDYDLGPESVVFDVGGYRGEWAEKIASRYDCRIHIFEPVEEYCREIRRKLGGNPKLVINNKGLAGKTQKCLISIDEAGSSVVKLDGKVTEIQLVDIDEYVSGMGIGRIDLIKVNIEGASTTFWRGCTIET
jgi:FkbM family methyltransferase